MFTERVHAGARLVGRARTREAILAAARDLFLHQDPDLVGIREVATRADVSVGTVMSVGGKDSLVVEVVDGLIRDVHASRGSAVSEQECPSDQVMDLLRPFIDLFEMHQDLARSYAGILIRGKCSSEVFGALADQLISEIHQVLTSAGAGVSDALRGAEAIHLTYLGAPLRRVSILAELPWHARAGLCVVRILLHDLTPLRPTTQHTTANPPQEWADREIS